MSSSFDAFPVGYAERVFRLFDFANENQILCDDLGCVLSALGYDPDATLSVASTLMVDEDSTPKLTKMLTLTADGLWESTSFGSSGSVATKISLSRFLKGIRDLQDIRGGKEDLVATCFRMFDIQRRGIVTVEDMLAVACLGENAVSAEVAKDIVLKLRRSNTIKGLVLRDFKLYLLCQ